MTETTEKKPLQVNILGLEDRIILPEFTNEVYIQSGEDLFKYVGKAGGLNFSDYEIMGYATLDKYLKMVIPTTNRVRIGFLKWADFPTTKTDYRLIWSTSTERKSYGDYQLETYHLFIYLGQIFSKNWGGCGGAITNLKSNAANQNIKLSDQLLELIFDPIEQAIYEKYRELKHF